MYKGKTFSLVLPAFNEESNVKKNIFILMNKSKKDPDKRKKINKYNFNLKDKNKINITPKKPVDTNILINNES